MNRQKEAVRWDETNLQQNAEESEAANRQKILEPKTPFHYLEEDGELPREGSELYVPKAEPARAGGPLSEYRAAEEAERQLQPGISPDELSALTDAALERRELAEDPRSPGDDDEEECQDAKRRKFMQMRKAHYNTGGLAALRAKAQAAMEEDDDDD